MLTNVVDADPAIVSIGTRVKVVLKDIAPQAPIPLFVLRWYGSIQFGRISPHLPRPAAGR
ncbi:hypothetical protein I3J27_33680 [Bradyrhizobium xenonodulans]|uniref:Uncharacterized protein n=2 Tax=Bradyrhizobium xenonodulans TaxID=2736875 RepID=A0ABY7MIV5_9BRAD|nr:hypothetical protein I3J27_33680 [Bradyrhizobium xenonodulans]